MPDVTAAPLRLPDGYFAAPIVPGDAGILRLCALVRKEPDAVAGSLVTLRDTLDAHVLLGVVLDAAGAVQKWVELWFQNIDGLAATPHAVRESLTNAIFDQRWQRTFKTFETVDPTLLIRTGWETKNPPATVIDLAKQTTIALSDPTTREAFVLCTDDALLAQKALPAYSATLHRYLHVPGKSTVFIPVSAGAPTNQNTGDITAVVGENAALVPLNLSCGLMLVRQYSPAYFENMLQLLGGGSWSGVLHGRSVLRLGALTDNLEGSSPTTEGRLFMGQHGKWGRLLESYHLKLRLLADAITAVRTFAQLTQRPILNLTDRSFQVHLADAGRGLPVLWTANTQLVDPGDALSLTIPQADVQYFMRASQNTSIYQPTSAGRPIQGKGAGRIRKFLTNPGELETILEGTFSTQERIEPGRNDLIWLRLTLAAGRIDLYAHLERDNALAADEWRFRTIRQRLTPAALAQLKAAEGVPLADVPFELVPLLSTPCDLYALAVLTVRALLVDPLTTLPVALDEMLSLARQVGIEHTTEASLPLRVRVIFERDRRWVTSLGPQHLSNEPLTPEQAFDLIPPELWFDTLALIIRMFPGIGPDSISRDLGDARPGGLHRIFDATLEHMDSLLLRSRSLIVIDWRFNREIGGILRRHATGMTDSGAGTRKAPPIQH